MTVSLPIPAAQYLRMSTEHQQYSTENQALRIEQYAQPHSFTVIHSYCDSAKSGLWLKSRPGLRELLRDVTEGILITKPFSSMTSAGGAIPRR